MQGVVQLTMALSGFLLVRVLDKREFAAYTIATSLQAILSMLTDSGIGTGLNAVGGRVWRDRGALSRLVSTVLEIRFKLAWVAVPVGVGFSLYLFRQNEVPWLKALSLTAVIIMTLWGLFNTSVYATPLRLHGKYLAVQKLELVAALIRLTLLCGLALIFINALAAVLVATIGATLQAVLVRRRAAEILDFDAPRDAGQGKELMVFIRKQFLTVFFFAFQGQITIWLISIFGNVEKVAELGALGRLSVLFAVIASVLNGVVVPTYARCETLARLVRLFLVSLAAYTVFAGSLFACSVLFPREILWVLGAKYAGLTRELPWMVAGSILGGFTGIVWSLATARGWIWHAWMAPILTIALQIILLNYLNLGEVKGVLIFGWFCSIPMLLLVTYMVVRGIIKSRLTGTLASC